MLFTAESLCPHVMKRNNLRVELMKASSARIVVSKSFATKTLLEQSGVDIINKIRCVVVSSAAKCFYKKKVFTVCPIFLSLFVLWGKNVSEVKLSLASFLSDRIVDEILMALSTSQHALVRSEQLQTSAKAAA